MSDELISTIERLKAQKLAVEKEERERGLLLGKQWVSETASYQQLRRLEGIDLADDNLAGALAFVLSVDDDAKNPYEGSGIDQEEDYESTVYAHFVAGAKEVWDSIKDRIQDAPLRVKPKKAISH